MSQFITGPPASRASQLSDAARVEEATAELNRVYPEAAAVATQRTATHNWRLDPYTGGAYAVWRPGQMVPFFSPWQQGSGRIRFAGEHTSNLAGYMESAVRSGHRVAGEIGRAPSGQVL
jgi:monoamine oxidase